MKLVSHLFFSREWTTKNNDTSGLQSAVKGNHTLGHVRQSNHNTITRLEAESLQGMGETIAQEVQLAVTDLLRKEDNGGIIRKVPGGIAEHIMHKLLGLRNVFRHITIVALQPGHLDMTSHVRTRGRISAGITCHPG